MPLCTHSLSVEKKSESNFTTLLKRNIDKRGEKTVDTLSHENSAPLWSTVSGMEIIIKNFKSVLFTSERIVQIKKDILQD